MPMDIPAFCLECWKAVELYNSGKIDSKPWEQLELLKEEAQPANFNKPNADGMRNLISALKKMFKDDVHEMLYFLKKNLVPAAGPQPDDDLVAFRRILMCLTYAGLGEVPKAVALYNAVAGTHNLDANVVAMNLVAAAILDLRRNETLANDTFNQIYTDAHNAAQQLDAPLRNRVVIIYPYPMSWMASTAMRTAAVGRFLNTNPNDNTLLTNYSTYVGTLPVLPAGPYHAPEISSDIDIAQQCACAAYISECQVPPVASILDQMEQAEAGRIEFVTQRSRLARTAATQNKSMFFVLRRWNSFTPIVPDYNNAAQVYRGGGYFIWHQNKGTVIDPGFRFIRNFFEKGGRVTDIDNVVVSHAHNDHTADLESIFTLLYQHNARIKDLIGEINMHLIDMRVAYERTLAGNPTDGVKRARLAAFKTPGTDTLDDWNTIRQILTNCNMAAGVAILNMDAIDRAVISMILPKGQPALNYTDPAGNVNINPTKPEDVLKRLGHEQKKITLYINLGTQKKFTDILDPDSPYFNAVHIIEPGNEFSLYDDGTNANLLVLRVHKALHNELVTKNYSVGLEFEFQNLNPGGTRTIVITADTSLCWKTQPSGAPFADYTGRNVLNYQGNEVFNDYPNQPDLLVAHIGSIKDYEVYPPSFNPKSFIYKNHLGIIGTAQVIAQKNPPLALITEFGEELTGNIEQAVDMTTKAVNAIDQMRTLHLTTKILPADLSFVWDLMANRFYNSGMGVGNVPTLAPGGGIILPALTAQYGGGGNNTFPITYA